jgi:transposase
MTKGEKNFDFRPVEDRHYLGLNPSEESSGGRRRLGAISKQGNTMVRWLLIEAVHPAVRKDAALRQDSQLTRIEG